jgi:hypothetical protein
MCHPEPIRFAQDKLREGSRFSAQGKLREACPEHSEGTHEILHFVQDETLYQILRLTRQNDKGYFLWN